MNRWKGGASGRSIGGQGEKWRSRVERKRKGRKTSKVAGGGRRQEGRGGKNKAQRECGRFREVGWIGHWKLLEEVVEGGQCWVGVRAR